MSTSSRSTGSAQAARGYQLSVNSYDRSATLLIALLILIGFGVLGLVVVFFTGRLISVIEPIPVVPVEATSPNANQGLAQEPDPPGSEEAPDLTEPQLQDTLDTLTTMSTQEALLADEMVDSETELGKGKGLGDARMAGPGGDGVVERVPRWERWKFRFEPESAAEFARWLDAYKIRVGVLGRDNKVYVAYGFNSGSPTVESDDTGEYNKWGRTVPTDGPMPALLQRLARKANIARHGPITVLFFSFDVESILWTAEKEYSKGRDVNTIRETVFTVSRDGDRYRFEVIDQKYFY